MDGEIGSEDLVLRIEREKAKHETPLEGIIL